jgi:hypothetical protein
VKAEACIAFLTALKATQIRVKENGWVEARCPLAKWTHKHGTDSSPSFGLSIKPGERSHFSCFACRSGSAEELLGMMEMYSHGVGYDFKTCHALLDEEQEVLPLPPYREFPDPVHAFQEWPAYWVESFPKAEWSIEASHYLQGRTVSLATAQKFDLRWDAKRQMIVAPFWDVYGRFAGARGRSIFPDVKYGHHDYTFQGVNNTRHVWYGEAALNLPGPVVCVEGQFDAMRVALVFPKVVAALSAKPTWEKFKKLGDCPAVLQIPDRDEAGAASTVLYAGFCKKLGVPHHVLTIHEGAKDPDDCSPDYLNDRLHEVLES